MMNSIAITRVWSTFPYNDSGQWHCQLDDADGTQSSTWFTVDATNLENAVTRVHAEHGDLVLPGDEVRLAVPSPLITVTGVGDHLQRDPARALLVFSLDRYRVDREYRRRFLTVSGATLEGGGRCQLRLDTRSRMSEFYTNVDSFEALLTLIDTQCDLVRRHFPLSVAQRFGSSRLFRAARYGVRVP